MADAVFDVMIAEAVRFEKSAFAGDLWSLSWLAMAIGAYVVFGLNSENDLIDIGVACFEEV